MPAPILLLAGAAALGLVGFAVSKSKGVGTTIVNADGSVNCDTGMPLNTCKAVNVALQVETDPAALRSFATSIPEFPKAASALLSKALTIESLTLTPVKPPASVPSAPPSTPPTNVAPNTPPASPPTILPDGPPAAPATPAAPPAFVQFDPGPLPRLSGIPASGNTDTASHRSVQAALKNFYDNTNVVDPATGDNFFFGRAAGDIDGKIGPKTQRALWGFQRYNNVQNGMTLTEDGLPGSQTNLVLQQWGFDPNASTQTSQAVFVES